MRRLRRAITAAQACQHLFVCALLVGTLSLAECEDQPKHVYGLSLSVYVVYMVLFTRLYVELHGKRVLVSSGRGAHKAKAG